eukprot:scaffold86_cov338-Pavlova_lutheri.AAC.65
MPAVGVLAKSITRGLGASYARGPGARCLGVIYPHVIPLRHDTRRRSVLRSRQVTVFQELLASKKLRSRHARLMAIDGPVLSLKWGSSPSTLSVFTTP